MRRYKCCKCGEEIDTVLTRFFDHNGDDYEAEIKFKQVPSNAIVFDVRTNWVGYGISDSFEDVENMISCPKCHKFPFKGKEVQCYEYLEVVCFKK